MQALLAVLVVFEAAALVVLGLVLRSYLPSYFSKKGENVATKEDVAAITHEIERVRQEYAAQLEVIKSSLDITNRLRSAAVEKRLEKHQEAFALWIQLLWNLHDETKIQETVGRCQEWWVNNSLYLDADSRALFKRAYLLANSFRHMRGQPVEIIEKMHADIEAAGGAIVRGAALPPMGKEESQQLGENAKS
jgi:hypothetical protein